MKKKVSILFLVFSIAMIVAIVYSFRGVSARRDDLGLLEKYGRGFNSIRSTLDMPLIERDWIVHELDSSHMYWGDPKRKVTEIKPYHLHKYIKLKSGKIDYEKDAFHYEGTGKIAYRLLIFTYMNNSKKKSDSFELLTYFRGSYPPSVSTMLSREKVDSLMTQWQQLNESLKLK